MLRMVLCSALIVGGTIILGGWNQLPRAEACLVSGIVAIVTLYILPPENGKRNPPDLLFNLGAMFAVYAILLKMHPALRVFIGNALAAFVSVTSLLVFAVAWLILCSKSEKADKQN